MNEDKKLKELSAELAEYCNARQYQLILAVKTKDDNNGQMVSFTGDVTNIIKNIVMFANLAEKEFELPILQTLITTCEGLIMTNDKNKKALH